MKNKNLVWVLVAVLAIIVVIWAVKSGQNTEAVVSGSEPVSYTHLTLPTSRLV